MTRKLKKEKNINDIITLSNVLDAKFRGPFGIRFGLDGIIGLIPGIGDFITSLISCYIVARAVSLNIPKPIIVKMAFNIIIDQVLGVIPLIGDIFDFAWKSNTKNMKLMDQYLKNPMQTQALSIFTLVGVFTLLLISLSLPFVLIFSVL